MSHAYVGTKVCTPQWKFYCYWPTNGSSSDFRMRHNVAQWINQNEKAFKKKELPQILQLIHEQFGSLSEIRVESRNNFGDTAWLKE